ncbi:hypothetical protein AWR41_00740 [Riemerella anatipestifer]|uniref:Uncharacterized protein n=1 Tax=Riemerella anatipestifer RA-CH-1 TaxID=1228997 RepID=J9QZ10_RIEAN|nr:hypothetical protein B739_0019 [Riemerella anatipestifer RA-CH-1]MSN81459.1 hypothetical protein [Riemerella anatipestifer]MSN87928.1 hypothetical protein [Riemerella anatipestifer]MSN91801.1 hypothetical protein [Riemerella anatipestifer]MSN93695.1 hypothetical protein [Riemerella anatipestifer]
MENLYWKHNEMTLEIFFIFSCIVVILLCFLSVISLYLGYSNRRDHVIILNIRKKYFLNGKYIEIFGELYNPKGKSFWNFIPDYFNLFYWLFFLGEIFICIFTIVKLSYSIKLSSIFIVWAVITLFVHLVLMALSFFFRKHYFKKYNKINDESIQ